MRHNTAGGTGKADLGAEAGKDEEAERPVAMRRGEGESGAPAERRRVRCRMEGFTPNPQLRLLDQCREVVRFHHFSYRTEETYIHWIRRYIVFRGKRHPREMGKEKIYTHVMKRPGMGFAVHSMWGEILASERKQQARTAAVPPGACRDSPRTGDLRRPCLPRGPGLREVEPMIRRTKAAPKMTAVKRRTPSAARTTGESIAVVLSSPPQLPPVPATSDTLFTPPATPSIPTPVRYLGNIAQLAGALHPARVRFPGNAAGAIGWMARQLGFPLPTFAVDIARTVLDPRGGWKWVDDRPGLTAGEYAEAAQRLADRGLLVIAVRTDWETSAHSVAVIAPGGMVAAAPTTRKAAGTRAPRRIRTPSPRIEDFTGRVPDASTPFVAEDWIYRQAPAWRQGT